MIHLYFSNRNPPNIVLCIGLLIGAIVHNVSHVYDVALSPTRAKGHVAKRRDAAPRSPRRLAGALKHIRAVIRSCAFEGGSSVVEGGRDVDVGLSYALWIVPEHSKHG